MYRIGIVGAGRAGTALGAALAAAGHRVTAASGRSAASLDRIRRLLPGAQALAPPEVAARADLLIITVPDDALAAVVAELAASGSLRAGQLVAHTSGAHGIGVLAPAVAVGARPLALHPAMTLSGAPLPPGVVFGVTVPPGPGPGPADLRAFAERLVADLGGSIEWVPEERRALYHAALAHGANHLVTLVNEALDRLCDAGVRHPQRMLDPLLRAALENTLRVGDAALTGPVSRGDAGTVAAHLAALSAVAPESVPLYAALARRTADRAIASGLLPAAAAAPLLAVLAGQPAGHPQAAPV